MSGADVTLLLLGLLFGAFALRSTLRLLRVLALLRRGERVEGRCAARRRVDRGPGMERRFATEYVFAFRTREGEDVEFTDQAPGLFGFEVGAPIRVTYDPAAPAKRATVAGPGAWWPLLAPAVFALGLGLLTLVLLYGFAAVRGWV
ncbi:DUF3592 domain-containing protein [Streptomyces sp. NPDC006368]|uniref:DUF3592 domain-containing protein n=1 Tax=Streptomyces sp. NPDC006368 TaxID=3156760 RepID=UPI0033B2A33B